MTFQIALNDVVGDMKKKTIGETRGWIVFDTESTSSGLPVGLTAYVIV